MVGKRLRIGTKVSLCLATIALLAFTTLATGANLKRSVLANGGGVGSGPGIRMLLAVGQPAAGRLAGEGLELCSGFYCGSLESMGVHRVFIPTIRR